MREQFSEQEWRAVLLLPVLVYERVAGADGVIDANEWDRFDQDLLDADELSEPLMHEVFKALAALARDPDWLSLVLAGLRESEESWVATARLALERQLDGQSYHRFIAGLLVWGMGIAQASGGYLGGLLGSKVSREELGALQKLADQFDLDPEVWRGF